MSPRCPKGTRRNKKTGECEQIGKTQKKCPKGTRRNKKTGECESAKVASKHYTPKSPEFAPPIEEIRPSKSEIREFREENVIEIPKIQLPEPIPIPRKVKSQMDYLSRRQKQFSLYAGIYDIGNLFYLYLLNKYRSNCLIYDQSYKNSQYAYAMYSSDHYDIGLTLDFRRMMHPTYKALHYRHLSNVAKQIADCVNNNKSEIIIIPLWLMFATSGHANVLIYRRFNNTVEHFEPHGESYSYYPRENKPIDDALLEFMTILNSKLPDVRFKPAHEVCVNMSGLQNIESGWRKRKPNEGGGYCAAWSMFFTELALKNPTIPSNELLDIIYKQMMESKNGASYLTKIIQGYAYYIQEKLEKYYAMLFDQPLIYTKLINPPNVEFQREFSRKLFFLVKIETRAINNSPWFNLGVARDAAAEHLASIPPKYVDLIKDAELELEVYDKLIAAKKELSPVRDLLDDSWT